jgi:hypothetical protein
MSYHITPQGNAAKCAATQGRCPFGGVDDHFNTKREAVEAFEAQNSGQNLPQTVKTVSPTLLKNSTYEAGFGARSYFRLLNHQDYEQAKNLYGKVKDAEVIEAVKEIHRASIAILDMEEQLNKAQERLGRAQTAQQRAGYIRNADSVAAKLTQATADFDAAEVRIDGLKKKYAKELAVHNNSLKALERLAESKRPITRPEGIERRIEDLKNVHRGITSVRPVADILGRGNLDRTVEAAKAYGNKYYLDAASDLRDATVEKESLMEKRERLQHILNIAENAKVKETVNEEIGKNDYAVSRLVPTIRAAEPRVALFKDEIRDRTRHEEDVTRELNALIKIEARTREVTG